MSKQGAYELFSLFLKNIFLRKYICGILTLKYVIVRKSVKGSAIYEKQSEDLY